MFLITGGLGKIGTIIRTRVEKLKDAKVFDVEADKEQNILHRETIYEELKNQQYEGVIHLAEMGQPPLEKKSNRDREVFDANIRGVKNLIDILRFSDTKIIYTTNLNKTRGDYDRAKRLNTNRLLAHRVSATILPLPEILPKEIADKPVAPKDLFDLLLKFAFIENDTYIIDRAPEDMIYLATDEMIADAFYEIVSQLDTLTSAEYENSHYIAISAGNFVQMIEKHFPGTKIKLVEGTGVYIQEEGVEKLEAYFKSLSFSAFHLDQAKSVADLEGHYIA